MRKRFKPHGFHIARNVVDPETTYLGKNGTFVRIGDALLFLDSDDAWSYRKKLGLESNDIHNVIVRCECTEYDYYKHPSGGAELAKKPSRPPVARCTVCSLYSRSPAQINQRCTRRENKKRCKGVFGSMLAPSDWKECPDCNGTGWIKKEKCLTCRGEGWIAMRPAGY